MSLETIKAKVSELKQFIITNNGNLEGVDKKLNGDKPKTLQEGEAKKESVWAKGIVKEIEENLSYMCGLLYEQKETIRNISSAVNGDNSDGCEGAAFITEDKPKHPPVKSSISGSGSFEG